MANLLRKISFFTAAELTVLTFFITSLLGGTAIWYTEKDRTVVSDVAVHETVNIESTNKETYHPPLRKEVHTTTKKVTHKGEYFIDSWFTSVSALCVTGLNATDFSKFTLPGQIVVLALIQIGGLGIIVFTSLFAMMVFRGITEKSSFRNLLGGVLDTEHHDVADMLKYVFIYTFAFEAIGALIMGAHMQWFVDKSLLNGINPWWWGVFHAISGYNNAGFSLMGNNLMSYVNDYTINLTIAALIILGGIGYPVFIAFYAMWRRKVLRRNDKLQKRLDNDFSGVASEVQIKVALIGTVLLLALGTLIPLIIEFNNPIMQDASLGQKILIAFFQSTSTRTAGFNTIDIGALHAATLFLYMILMFIGANPAGTAGGIKIPTVAVLYGYIKDWFKEPGKPVELMGERISKFAVSHAVRLFFFATSFITIVAFIIMIDEKDFLITPDPTFNFLKILFELFSAYGTVGLTMGYPGGAAGFSALLSPFSKTMLILAMLVGRVGALTLLAALPWKRAHSDKQSPDFEEVQRIQIG